MTREPTRVLLVADGDALAAKLEAMLRDDPRLRVRVGSLRALARLVEDHDPALVILASSAAHAAAALGTVVDVPHVPPVVLLVEDVRAAWTAGMRRAADLVADDAELEAFVRRSIIPAPAASRPSEAGSDRHHLHCANKNARARLSAAMTFSFNSPRKREIAGWM